MKLTVDEIPAIEDVDHMFDVVATDIQRGLLHPRTDTRVAGEAPLQPVRKRRNSVAAEADKRRSELGEHQRPRVELRQRIFRQIDGRK